MTSGKAQAVDVASSFAAEYHDASGCSVRGESLWVASASIGGRIVDTCETDSAEAAREWCVTVARLRGVGPLQWGMP